MKLLGVIIIAILIVGVLFTSHIFQIPYITPLLQQQEATATTTNQTMVQPENGKFNIPRVAIPNDTDFTYYPDPSWGDSDNQLHHHMPKNSTAQTSSTTTDSIGQSSMGVQSINAGVTQYPWIVPSSNHGTAGSTDGFCEFPDNTCGDVSYYHGAVMKNPKVALLFWSGRNQQCQLSPWNPLYACYDTFDDPQWDPYAANPSDNTYEQLITQFVYDLCTESQMGQPLPFSSADYAEKEMNMGLMGLLQQYPALSQTFIPGSVFDPTKGFAIGGTSVSHYIGSCTLIGTVEDFNAPPSHTGSGSLCMSNCVTDKSIAHEVHNYMKWKHWSADDNTLVVVFLPYEFTGEHGCGYHSSYGTGVFGWGSKQIWAVIYDEGNPEGSGNGCNMVGTDGTSGEPGMLTGPGNSGVSPNNDPVADATITSTWHELAESFTRPQEVGCCTFETGWIYCPNGLIVCAKGVPLEAVSYDSQGSGEMADMCSGDYPGTQPDGSDVHLNGDNYRVQAIWSNYNGGCTLDLNGPPTSVTETLVPDSSTTVTAASPPPTFNIHYWMTGDLLEGSTMQTTPSTGNSVTQFYVTCCQFSSLVITDPDKAGASEYCFEINCNSQEVKIGGPTTSSGSVSITYYYYHLMQEDPYLNLVNSPPNQKSPDILLTYVAAPAVAGDADAPQTLVLHLTPQQPAPRIYALIGSQAIVPTCTPKTILGNVIVGGGSVICGNFNGQRWFTGDGAPCSAYKLETCLPITYRTSDMIEGIRYFDQYAFTGSYSVDSGSPAAPVLTSTADGAAYTVALTTSASGYWLDAGAAWSVTNPLITGNGAEERWITKDPVSGEMSKPVVTSLKYSHQYWLEMESNPQNDGCVSLNSGDCVSLNSGWENAGASVTITATANNGYAFAGWTGSGSGSCSSSSSNSCSVTMTGPIFEYANFGTPEATGLSVTLLSPANAATIHYSDIGSQQFSVIVTSATGQPVPNANVAIYEEIPGSQSVVVLVCSGQTDSTGTYTVPWPQSGAFYDSLKLRHQYSWYATASMGSSGGTSDVWTFTID